MVPKTHRQGEKEGILVVVRAILTILLAICSFNRGGRTVQNEILPRVPYYPGLEHAWSFTILIYKTYNAMRKHIDTYLTVVPSHK